jgi:low affinity Fe/Cu permease
MPTSPHRPWFARLATVTAHRSGSPAVFLVALALVAAWAASGPFFGFSNTWQLAINSCTTVATFLMVFLIQNTQNRDSIAMQVKLDELIRASDRAHNVLLDLEELDDRTLERIRSRYRHLAEEARAELARGETDTDVREVESPGR